MHKYLPGKGYRDRTRVYGSVVVAGFLPGPFLAIATSTESGCHPFRYFGKIFRYNIQFPNDRGGFYPAFPRLQDPSPGIENKTFKQNHYDDITYTLQILEQIQIRKTPGGRWELRAIKPWTAG